MQIWSKRLGKGSFFDSVNWKEKNAPDKNEVVVISSASEVTVSKKMCVRFSHMTNIKCLVIEA